MAMIINANSPEVSIVVPLYNEQENFKELTQRLKNVCSNLPFTTEVVLVDDGSKDQTPFLMFEIGTTDNLFSCVFLSRNHGHQLAVTAGISSASATKAIFIIDGDLQDPPELINEFYSKLNEGNDVVFGVRKKRKESANKVFLYWVYYRILKYISNVDVQIDSGDFSMISRRMANYMIMMPEKSRYLRGMRSWIGFKQVGLEYERQARFAGEPKYTFKKLFELAYNGIFNFSDFPVKFITKVGGITMFFSFLFIVYTLIKKFYFGGVPQGFTSLIIFSMLFTGLQLLALGLLGEYITRIYNQVQNRPLFIIDKKIIKGEIKIE
jgi:glycosyltransferase involved in cell wall biosynthesis